MSDDERAIRALIDAWLAASKSGDTVAILGLMTDDAVFLVPGQPPFGREAFAAAADRNRQIRVGPATHRILELHISGDWAWMRSHLDITFSPPGAIAPIEKSGAILTILCKGGDGRWRLARDANLLSDAK